MMTTEEIRDWSEDIIKTNPDRNRNIGYQVRMTAEICERLDRLTELVEKLVERKEESPS